MSFLSFNNQGNGRQGNRGTYVQSHNQLVTDWAQVNAEFPSAVELYKIVLLTSVLLSNNLQRAPGLGNRIEMGEEARQTAIGYVINSA